MKKTVVFFFEVKRKKMYIYIYHRILVKLLGTSNILLSSPRLLFQVKNIMDVFRILVVLLQLLRLSLVYLHLLFKPSKGMLPAKIENSFCEAML
jgi:hypothetical protein